MTMSMRAIVRYRVALLVAANFLLFLDGVMRHYPTVDEARLVPAGIVHWRTGEFEAANDVPPLARMISALPVLGTTRLLGPIADFDTQKYWTEAFGLDVATLDASKFVYHNRNQFMTLFGLARAPNFLWWALGAWLIHRWARELHGDKAGWFALVLWSFGPNVLAREQTATPDLPLAVLTLAATYAYQRWLNRPEWEVAALAGALLGVALLTDHAAATLPFAWAAMAALRQLVGAREASPLRVRLVQIALGSALSLWVLNSGYLFAGWEKAPNGFGLGRWTAVIPADYRTSLAGRWYDIQGEADEFSVALPATIRGYFSWRALATKVPLGTWALILGGAAASIGTARIGPPIAERCAAWLVPSTALFLGSSSCGAMLSTQSVLLLAAPFGIVIAAGLASRLQAASWKTGIGVVALLAWSVASSLAIYPNPLCYMNEAGGAGHGPSRSLYTFPGDGGHDVAALKAWLKERPNFQPIGLALRQVADPRALGIESTIAPASNVRGSGDPRIVPWYSPMGGPYPGRYAVDTYCLNSHQYDYFKELEPIDRIGGTILAYDVSRADAEGARRRLGFPPLENNPAVAAAPEIDDAFVRSKYRDASGVEYEYAVFAPPKRPGFSHPPAILFLHGFDEREGGPRGNIYLDVTFPAAVKERREDFPFVAVVPQGKSGKWSTNGADADMALGVLDKVLREYEVDVQRVYLTGVSSGGSGVWTLAASRPSLWAAIVPISSAGCNPASAATIAHIPTWCFHNIYDFNYPIEGPRAMINSIRKAGGSPRFTEYFALTSDVDRSSGLGSHDAWSKAYRLDALYTWMYRQHK